MAETKSETKATVAEEDETADLPSAASILTKVSTYKQTAVKQLREKCIEAIKEVKKLPFFATVRATYERQGTISRYAEEVSYEDEIISEVVEQLKKKGYTVEESAITDEYGDKIFTKIEIKIETST